MNIEGYTQREGDGNKLSDGTNPDEVDAGNMIEENKAIVFDTSRYQINSNTTRNRNMFGT